MVPITLEYIYIQNDTDGLRLGNDSDFLFLKETHFNLEIN